MPERLIENKQLRPRPVLTLLLFLLATFGMGYLRLSAFPDELITVTYGLPLLVCLWYPSPALLWSMSAAFIAMSGYKTYFLLPHELLAHFNPGTLWAMQVANVIAIAVSVQIIMQLLASLQAKNTLLTQTNEQLVKREEEITRQNEELQAQSEELTRQNQEIEQQTEALQQQREELEAQSEELHGVNAELEQRQRVLERMLHVLHTDSGGRRATDEVCEVALQLFAANATAAAVLLRGAGELTVSGGAGALASRQSPLQLSASLAAVALEHQRTAAITDLALRPDIIVLAADAGKFRAVLATPLWLGGQPAGVLEFYSLEPHDWTSEHFAIAEWCAAQCSLILEARQLRDDLRQANIALEAQVAARTKELQDLVNELEHFSYTITHDLRAPLRAMQGYAGILEEESLECLDESGRGYLRRIIVAATRMDQLITDALSYSRAVRQELAMVPVDPARLLREIVESYPGFQPPHSRVEIVGPIPPVLANEAGLTQCFSNLIGNAVKFVSPGVRPLVRIRSESRDSMVRLWVEDNGIGIAPEMQSRLFTMFQRLSKNYDGTGIGLALVRKVAERMGGKVGVESAPGRGSRFWVELRAAPRHDGGASAR